MNGKGKGLLVQFNGDHGIAFNIDQKKKFRCPCCGSPTSKEGKVLVTPTDKHGGILEGEKKRIVSVEDINVRGFVD